MIKSVAILKGEIFVRNSIFKDKLVRTIDKNASVEQYHLQTRPMKEDTKVR